MSGGQSQAQVEDELRPHGVVAVDKVLVGSLEERNAAVQVTIAMAQSGAAGGEDSKALLLMFRFDTIMPKIRDWLDELLLYSSLCHPHIATIQAIFRMRACVCLRLQHCNGGCVFPMVVRGGPGGIAQAAAVFLIQQATLAADFLHRFDKYLHALSPQSLRVHWNATGVPILKIISVPLPAPAPPTQQDAGDASPSSAGARLRAVATMWTSPHSIRPDVTRVADDKRFCIACDVWALCVIAYFTLFGSWPFPKAVIGAWVEVAADEWRYDKDVKYLKEDGTDSDHDAQLLTTLQDVFAAGGQSAAAFATEWGDLKLLTELAWFQKDLPAGAERMTQTYCGKTEQRRGSPDFGTLSDAVQQVVRTLDRSRP